MAKTILQQAKSKLSKISAPIRLLSYCYLGFVALVMVLYVLVYIYEIILGKSLSKDLLPFIQMLISPTLIGCITFLLGLCVDKDNDGIPDVLEKGDNK